MTDETRTTCARLHHIARLERALTAALPLLRDLAHLTGFGETHAATVNAITIAEISLKATSDCTGCAFYQECH